MTKWLEINLRTTYGDYKQNIYINCACGDWSLESELSPARIDKIPETQEEIDMFYMLNPEFDIPWVREKLSSIKDSDVQWETGLQLSGTYDEYMYRMLTAKGLDNWR